MLGGTSRRAVWPGLCWATRTRSRGYSPRQAFEDRAGGRTPRNRDDPHCRGLRVLQTNRLALVRAPRQATQRTPSAI